MRRRNRTLADRLVRMSLNHPRRGTSPSSRFQLDSKLQSQLHGNTGHRSNLRLARALAISGAPAEAVQAAKNHTCDICQERRQPKARRPASLPTPKDAGDQANIDLLDVVDSDGTKFAVVHMIDYATRFQLAELLPQKTASHVSPSSRSDGFRCLAAQRSWSQIRAVNLSVTSWLSFAPTTAFCFGIVELGRMAFASEPEDLSV